MVLSPFSFCVIQVDKHTLLFILYTTSPNLSQSHSPFLYHSPSHSLIFLHTDQLQIFLCSIFLLPFAWVVSYITFYICIEQTTQNIKLGFIFAVLISAAYPVTYRFKKFFFMQYLIQKNIINGDNLQRGFVDKKIWKDRFPITFLNATERGSNYF